MMIWYKEKQQGADDIMVSTRIRLARNLAKYPFPNAMTTEQAKKRRRKSAPPFSKAIPRWRRNSGNWIFPR